MKWEFMMPDSHASKPTTVMPKGLAGTVEYGFNANTWSFTPNSIFTVTFTKQDPTGSGKGWVYLKDFHLSPNDTAFSVPDGMLARPEPGYDQTNTTIFHGTHSVDEQDFKVSLSASLKMDGVSTSVSTSLATHSSITTNTKQSTALIAAWKAFYSVDVIDPPGLDADFEAALKQLPEPYAASQQGQFATFFESYGTHYLRHGMFGGTFTMRTVPVRSRTRYRSARPGSRPASRRDLVTAWTPPKPKPSSRKQPGRSWAPPTRRP